MCRIFPSALLLKHVIMKIWLKLYFFQVENVWHVWMHMKLLSGWHLCPMPHDFKSPRHKTKSSNFLDMTVSATNAFHSWNQKIFNSWRHPRELPFFKNNEIVEHLVVFGRQCVHFVFPFWATTFVHDVTGGLALLCCLWAVYLLSNFIRWVVVERTEVCKLYNTKQ